MLVIASIQVFTLSPISFCVCVCIPNIALCHYQLWKLCIWQPFPQRSIKTHNYALILVLKWLEGLRGLGSGGMALGASAEGDGGEHFLQAEWSH